MKIILAQGNPGEPYLNTRHNIGFAIIDAFSKNHGGQWSEKSKFKALISEVSIDNEKVLLIKPTTFYNLTGESARALIDFYKLSAEKDLLVVHDDLALDFGKIRIRKQGSDAGNNGIKSLNAHLGEHYTRLRIGTANEILALNPDTDFVLSKFSSDEQSTINEKILPLCDKIITEFCQSQLDDTSFSFDISGE